MVTMLSNVRWTNGEQVKGEWMGFDAVETIGLGNNLIPGVFVLFLSSHAFLFFPLLSVPCVVAAREVLNCLFFTTFTLMQRCLPIWY